MLPHYVVLTKVGDNNQEILRQLVAGTDGFAGAAFAVGDFQSFAESAEASKKDGEGEKEGEEAEGDDDVKAEENPEGAPAADAAAAEKRALAWRNTRDTKIMGVQEKLTRATTSIENSLKKEEEEEKFLQLLKSSFVDAPLVRAHTVKAKSVLKCIKL